MSFQPILPFGGYAGWAFLQRTMGAQQQAMQKSPVNQRDEAYFRDRIGDVASPDDLVNDRRLLRIALESFGLEDDLNAKAFVRKILADGTDDRKALANRLADKRYLAFAQAFAFSGPDGPETAQKGFADRILAQRQSRVFEVAVGEADNNLRLALNAQRELGELAGKDMGEDAKWFTLMGNQPLREVVEGALGLPSSFGKLDIDQQLRTLKQKAQRSFGSSGVDQFTDPDKMNKLVRDFLIRREAAAMVATSPALLMLQNIGR